MEGRTRDALKALRQFFFGANSLTQHIYCTHKGIPADGKTPGESICIGDAGIEPI